MFEEFDNFKIKIARFETAAEDFIDSETTLTTTTTVNIPNASLSGIEIDASYSYERFTINWGFTDITGENDDTGEFLGSLTPRQLTQTVNVEIPEFDGTAGWRTNFVDAFDKVTVINQAQARDGYVTHDVYYNWEPEAVENFALNLGIDNLFDKRYEKVFGGSFEPGRNIKLLGSYSW